jgi:hypothetical protein
MTGRLMRRPDLDFLFGHIAKPAATGQSFLGKLPPESEKNAVQFNGRR